MTRASNDTAAVENGSADMMRGEQLWGEQTIVWQLA
jgi:hypothetical protein